MLQNGFRGIFHVVPGLAVIVGQFDTDGSGDIDSAVPTGLSAVTRATAAYSLVFNDKILDVYVAAMAADDDAMEAMASYTAGTKTLLFNLSAAKTSTTVRFYAFVKTSVVG